uniref:AlNc14C92G5729 protein n=1 Tax=Albugo laibachii Nc14 TaxID=890382 RepID=F0WGJ5_9STRA|nr:AlNc14C92G5729 [Albugo laibachii Nc14]|eukprot:CCA20359.1 AlNc14C92G5729 [Albugo laibachii Nc14]
MPSPMHQIPERYHCGFFDIDCVKFDIERGNFDIECVMVYITFHLSFQPTTSSRSNNSNVTSDCFTDKLLDGLPPRRAVKFDLQPKLGAIPSARPPFRLSNPNNLLWKNSYATMSKKDGWKYQTLLKFLIYLIHHVKNPPRFYARPIPKAAPVILDDVGEYLYVVESLLQRKIHKDKIMLLVKVSIAKRGPDSNISLFIFFQPTTSLRSNSSNVTLRGAKEKLALF